MNSVVSTSDSAEIHKIDEFPIGIISDIHGNLAAVETVLYNNPKVKQWFCLGDIVDFTDRFRNNVATVDWWRECNIPTILGNHDVYISQSYRLTPESNQWLRTIKRSMMLLLPNANHLLCYHSLPNDLVTFVEPGFSEREFVDEYPIDENTEAVLIGHNHKQFKSVYYGCHTELWSVGSLGMEGEYVTIDLKGIHFHRDPSIDVKFK